MGSVEESTFRGEKGQHSPATFHRDLPLSSSVAFDNMLAYTQPPTFESGNAYPIDGTHNYDFMSTGFHPGDFSSQQSDWAAVNAHMSKGMWPPVYNDNDLRLQTQFSDNPFGDHMIGSMDNSAGSPLHSASFSSATAVDPSHISNSTSISNSNSSAAHTDDTTPPRKRSETASTPSRTSHKHKRNRTASKVVLKKEPSPSPSDDGSPSQLDNPDLDDAKREKFLARNRVAASKCRQKKKEWTNQLEDRARELSSQRSYLTATVNLLRNELLELKCKCLEHTNCDCGRIRDYLKSTVAALSPASELYRESTYRSLPGLAHIDGRRESEASTAASDAHNLSDRLGGSLSEGSDGAASYPASPTVLTDPELLAAAARR